MIIYKVTTRTNKSCLAQGKARVQYEIGKPARAPEWLAQLGYHPCGFRTLESARNFRREYCCGFGRRFNRHKGWKIYKAEGEGIMRRKRDRFSLIDIARGVLGFSLPTICRTFPTGTVMCKEITLLEEVK